MAADITDQPDLAEGKVTKKVNLTQQLDQFPGQVMITKEQEFIILVMVVHSTDTDELQ